MSTFSSDQSQDCESFNRRQSVRNERSRSRSPRRNRVNSKRIVIANIPYDITWQKLKEIFREQIGFTGFLQLYKTNGRPNGIGLMEFKTFEGAEKAIETMHRFEIGDRKLVVREENPRDLMRFSKMEVDSPLPIENQPKLPSDQGVMNPMINPQMLNQCNIEGPITDSLDYSVTWQKLKDVFKSAGRILSVVLKTDNDGKSRGVAIIKFSNSLEAIQSVKMFNNQILKDRPMRIKIDRQGTPDSLCGNMGQQMGKLGSNGIISSSPQSASSTSLAATLVSLLGLKSGIDVNTQSLNHVSNNNSNNSNNSNNNNNSNFLTDILRSIASNNISALTMNTDNPNNANPNFNLLSQIFNSGSSTLNENPNPMNRMPSNINRPGSFNMPTTTGLSQEGLQQLISAATVGGMPQHQIGNILSTMGILNQSNSSVMVEQQSPGLYENSNRYDEVYDNYSGGRSKYAQSSGYSNLRLNSNITVNSNSIPKIGQDNRSRRSGQKLVVKNLPFTLTSQDLKRLFREVGNVRTCNLPIDGQGRAQGIAFLTFDNDEHLERAIGRFDGSMYQGRRLRLHVE